MKYYLFILIVAISICSFANAQQKCIYGNNDFSPLYNSTGYTSTDSDGNLYFFNVCGPTPICNPIGSSFGTVSACQLIEDTTYPITAGDIQYASWNVSPSYVIYLSYGSNSTCSNGQQRTFRINLKQAVISSISVSKVVEYPIGQYQVNFFYPPSMVHVNK